MFEKSSFCPFSFDCYLQLKEIKCMDTDIYIYVCVYFLEKFLFIHIIRMNQYIVSYVECNIFLFFIIMIQWIKIELEIEIFLYSYFNYVDLYFIDF